MSEDFFFRSLHMRCIAMSANSSNQISHVIVQSCMNNGNEFDDICDSINEFADCLVELKKFEDNQLADTFITNANSTPLMEEGESFHNLLTE